MAKITKSVLAPALALFVSGLAVDARADGFDTPAAGVAQMGRGGAWVARADDPLAAFFNPAAMVRNPNGVHVGSHLMVRRQCFERLGADGQPLSPGGGLNAPTDPVCAEIAPFPNPQLGATFRIGRRFAVGLAVVGPHKTGKAAWPDVVSYANKFGIVAPHPAATRYLMLEDDATLAYPTLSAAFAVTSKLSIGAGFVWGLANFGFSNMAPAVSSPSDDFSTDIKAKLSGFDGFVPGVVLSALFSPSKRIDIAGTFRYSDAIRSSIDLYAQSNYYTQGRVNEDAIRDPANITDVKNAGTFKLQIPMEARLGFRYHKPRYETPSAGQRWLAKHQGAARDAMSEDLFDLEADLTYSQNSAVQSIQVRMNEATRINGTPGYVPANADVPRRWRDIIGMRVGGEFVLIPDLIALRAGGFFESKGVDDAYVSLDFQQAMKFGVSAGATVRIAMLDVSAGYSHTFFAAQDNHGKGAVHGLAGDATANFRTPQVINGGRQTGDLDEVALGVTAHF